MQAAAPPSTPTDEPSTPRRAALPWVITAYFAEGLPYSIVHQTSAELFTAMGATTTVVASTSLYGLAWNLKFLWSPLVDLTGTTRRWMIALQLMLAVAIGALAFPAGEGHIGAVARMLIAVSVLAATHDIAIDGFYMRALAKSEQASLSGLRVAAYRVALLVGKGALVALAGLVSWRACFFTAGGLLGALAIWHAVMLPAEPPAAATLSLGRFLEAFRTFVGQPRAAASIAFIVLYRAGDAMMFSVSPKFLASLGLDLATRGFVNATVGTLAGIAGGIVGGALIARHGLARTIGPLALAQSLAILVYVGLAIARPPFAVIVGGVVIEQLVAGLGNAALVVFLMSRCTGAYKATHFAVGSALMSLMTTFAGPPSGWIADHAGFVTLFAVAFAASLPGVLLTRAVPKD